MPLLLKPPLRTARLILRDFEPADFDAIHAFASDPDVTRYMFHGPRSVEDTQDYLARMLESQRQNPRMVWEFAVVQPADRRLVGACDLTLENLHDGDLGFMLARDVWGHGYATEAARAMVRAGFEELGLSRITATCDVDHHASARVLEKAGLRCEGTLQKHKFIRGRWWTSLLYAASRDHWSSP